MINRYNLNHIFFILYLPFSWNFILLTNKINGLCAFFYSPTYFFLFPYPETLIRFNYDRYTSTLCFLFYTKHGYYSIFWNSFKSVFYSFSKFFFKKIKFKGKGYYIYKNIRNTIALRFGYSHIVRVYCFSTRMRFLTKTSIFMFGINYLNILKCGYKLFSKKPINVFTGRGLRFSRQVVYRKTGKISSYR